MAMPGMCACVAWRSPIDIDVDVAMPGCAGMVPPRRPSVGNNASDSIAKKASQAKPRERTNVMRRLSQARAKVNLTLVRRAADQARHRNDGARRRYGVVL